MKYQLLLVKKEDEGSRTLAATIELPDDTTEEDLDNAMQLWMEDVMSWNRLPDDSRWSIVKDDHPWFMAEEVGST